MGLQMVPVSGRFRIGMDPGREVASTTGPAMAMVRWMAGRKENTWPWCTKGQSGVKRRKGVSLRKSALKLERGLGQHRESL